MDERIAVPLPSRCPYCQGPVEFDGLLKQYQGDVVRPTLVRRLDVAVGHCRHCGRRAQGCHPLQTSDTLGAAQVQLGPEAVALAAQLNKQMGLSLGQYDRSAEGRFWSSRMCAGREPCRKRFFDLAFSMFALALTSPLFVLVAIAVKLGSPGPVFYRDRRIGRGGREFLMWKFRSMVADANRTGWNITVEGDPRITRVGRFLRHWKIDELPNLFNVLMGDMSIVGPRPEVPEYTRYYTPLQRRILAIRPGITDLATASKYRHEQQILAQVANPKAFYINTVMQEKLRLNFGLVDTRYSLRRDLRLMVKTLIAILSKDCREL